MTTLVHVVVAGVLVGGLYGLISSGLSLSFGITRLVNFAHGDFVTIGMYLFVATVASQGAIGLLLAPVFAIAIGALGMLFYALFLGRAVVAAVSEEEAHTPQIVITAAASVFIQSGLLAVFTSTARSAGGVLDQSIDLGGIVMPVPQLVAFAVALAVFAFFDAVVNHTEFGRALRAVVDDADAAALVGVSRRTVYALSFGIGAAMAGLAGVLLSTYEPVTPQTGADYLAIAFVTVVLGGLGSIRGAFIAGLIIGTVQQAAATYVALDLQNEFLWATFIVLLLLRPSGLFGRPVTA